jgi:hypothetical protein
MDTEEKKQWSGLSVLMQLESLARRADSLKALQFIIVNDTRKLISYRQAYLLSSDQKHEDIHRLQAASSVAIVDKDAHLTKWMEKLVSHLHGKKSVDPVQQIDMAMCPQEFKA